MFSFWKKFKRAILLKLTSNVNICQQLLGRQRGLQTRLLIRIKYRKAKQVSELLTVQCRLFIQDIINRINRLQKSTIFFLFCILNQRLVHDIGYRYPFCIQRFIKSNFRKGFVKNLNTTKRRYKLEYFETFCLLNVIREACGSATVSI